MNFEYSSNLPFISPLLPFFLIGIIGVIILIVLLVYIFESLSLYTMAKQRHFSHAWLAWIPTASGYIRGGLIGDDVQLADKHLPHASIALPVGSAVIGLLISASSGQTALASAGCFVLVIAFMVYAFAALYQLYLLYSPTNAVAFLVLSIVFPILEPFFLFAIRNNQPDFSKVTIVPSKSVDSFGIMALSFGILTVLNALIGSSIWIGCLAIIFGVLGYRRARTIGASTTLSLIGLGLGCCGIILGILLPGQTTSLNHTLDIFDQQNSNDTFI